VGWGEIDRVLTLQDLPTHPDIQAETREANEAHATSKKLEFLSNLGKNELNFTRLSGGFGFSLIWAVEEFKSV
jgi:hypothetical protein